MKKIMPSFYYMPVFEKMPVSENITASKKNRHAVTTYEINERLLSEITNMTHKYHMSAD